MRCRSALAMAAFLLACVPPNFGFAEPIISNVLLITSGDAEFDWTDRFSGFNLIGSNFEISLVAEPSRSPRFVVSNGRVTPSFEGFTLGDGFGRIAVDGRVRDLGENGDWIFRYRIDGPDIEPVVGEGVGHLAFPFRFSASLTGGDIGDRFSYEFSGQGRGAWVTNESLDFTRYGVFDFEEAAPVPEPGTLLLVAGAMAVAGYRSHKRNRR